MSPSSALFPEFDSASTTSPAPIIPRSPWLASAGWTNCARVPVDARVAAILRATWPLLPMPVTITRPVATAIMSSAAPKAPLSAAASSCNPAISARMTRRATARSPARRGSCRSPFAAAARLARVSSITPLYAPLTISRAKCGIPKAWSARSWRRRRSVCEDVLLRPPFEVKQDTRRQEPERGLRQLGSPLSREHRVEPDAQRVQMKDIGRGVAQLLVGQRRRAPIRALLLFRQIDVEQILAQIAQPVPVGKGADQTRGDFGAIDR